MTPNTKFEITIPNDGPSNHVSGIVNTVMPRGAAVGAHQSNADNEFRVAEHNNFVGFLMRDVTLTGITAEERLLGERLSNTPVGAEWPAKVGDKVSARAAYEVEVEGAEYIWLSGTGAITTATDIPQALAFLNGRLRIAQSGEVVNGTLAANNLTPSEDGALRIRVRLI